MRKPIISVGDGEIVYDGKFNQVLSFPFENTKNKKKGVWEVVKRKGVAGMVSGILGVTDDLHVILVRTFRIPLNDWVIQCCYGGAKKGETEEDAARRELLEETGYGAEKTTRLFQGPFNPALTSEQMVLYLGINCIKVHDGKRDAAEDMDVFLIPLRESPMILHEWSAHSLVDIKLWGPIYAAQELLLRE